MNRLHRTLAGFLATVMLASPVLAVDWQWQSKADLGATVALSAGQYVQNGNQTEYVIEVGPDDGLTPQVYYGNTLYGRSTLDTLAAQLKAQGLTPVGAINGSFFDMSTGLAYGPVVTDGILRTSGSGDTVGFLADGSAIIGSPNLSYQVTWGTNTLNPHLNRTLSNKGGMVLFTPDYDTSTKSWVKSYHVVLKPEKTNLKLGETTKAQVVDIVEDKANGAIPAGCFVLAMTMDTDYQYTLTTQLQALKIGDTVTVKSQVTPGWEDVVYACGGMEMLVKQGVAQTAFTLDSAKNQTGRTAVGIKANGDVVLYTVDGLRSGYSAGMTLAQLANRMVELGCVTALNLDGGGSTTMAGRYLGTDKLVTLNSPSDGSQRKCANFIFLTRKTTPATEATNLHVYPHNSAMLAGASQRFTTLASDANEMVATAPQVTYEATGGIIGSGGSFTAGSTGETVTVTAKSGNLSGSSDVLVVANPTAITVSVEGSGASKVALGSGGVADLTATAKYLGYDLVAEDHNFQWSVPKTLGTIDENGRFQAAETWVDLAGNITVTAGTTQKTITVTIAKAPPEGAVIANFETDTLQGQTGMTATLNTNRAYVRYGKGSGNLTYDVTDQTQAMASFVALTEGNQLGLWVYGDGSNNSLSARFDHGTLWLTQLNFTGWKWITATIPEKVTAVTGLYVTAHKDATASTGTIYVDQMTATRGSLADTTPPVVTLTEENGKITAKATDSGSGLASLTLYVDGKAVNGTTWTVPDNSKTHQVRAEARDKFGNLGRKTVTLANGTFNPFGDMGGHWAKSSVAYAYGQGYLKGSANSDGTLLFRPDDTMTRQEFAVALLGFLQVDTAQYQNVALPYRDKSQIATWAEPAVKAAYDLGLMTGSLVNGKVYAMPTAPITRQEAMVILARTQEKGYGAANLSQFADQGKIAAWAKADIATMVAQGVIQGSEGNLDPEGSVTRAQVAKMLQGMR